MPNPARVFELFDYEPATGWFTNRVSRGRAAEGAHAGSPTGHGYRRIIIDYEKVYEHQLAWFFVHDEWVEELDHIDGDGTNNAIANLRIASRTQNNLNSEREAGASGLRGVYWNYGAMKWYAKSQLGGVQKWLGNFDTPEEAHEAYKAYVDLHHGGFGLHNRPQSHQEG